MKVTILGSGAFGLALGHLFVSSHNHVTIWSKFQHEVDALRDKYLEILFTTNIESAIEGADIVIIAVPIAFVYDTILSLQNLYRNQSIIIASKGIDSSRLKFGFQILEELLPDASYGILSGGTFAKDMMNDKIMGITLATTDKSIETVVKCCLENSSFLKIQISRDVIGTSVCGAVKNIMAIGFGMLDGYQEPPSSKFLFLTEAILEIQKLIMYFEGDKDTILSYAGIDDIMMTCTSSESRNYTLGVMIGKNTDLKEIQDYKNSTTIEGLETTQAICSLLDYNKNLFPLISTIYEILYHNLPVTSFIQVLKNV